MNWHSMGSPKIVDYNSRLYEPDSFYLTYAEEESENNSDLDVVYGGGGIIQVGSKKYGTLLIGKIDNWTKANGYIVFQGYAFQTRSRKEHEIFES